MMKIVKIWLLVICFAVASMATVGAADAYPVTEDGFMSSADRWDTGLHITNVVEVNELLIPNEDFVFPVITAEAPCVITVLKNVDCADGPFLGNSVSIVELDENNNLIRTGKSLSYSGVLSPEGYIEAGATYELSEGCYLLGSANASQQAVIVVQGESHGEAGSLYEIYDEKGNVYTLSLPIVETSIYENGDTFYPMYVLSEGTTVTAHNGIIFVLRIGTSIINPDASGGDSPQTDVVACEGANWTHELRTSAGTTLYFMTIAEEEASAPAVQFSDVASDAWYYESVQWAVNQGITLGTSETTFSPDALCTRAQIITFLWRAAGEPLEDATLPFVDVTDTTAYYVPALIWAVAHHIVESAENFFPDLPCTREQTVSFMYRFSGKPEAPAANFTDVAVSADYAAAVGWAVDAGVTSGTSDTTFSPEQTCTRGQIVTFLYRLFN